MRKAALIANGEIKNDAAIRPLILEHDFIVAVDGGLRHLERMKITPHLFIGDGDSSHLPPKEIPQKTFPPDKDFTDLELALQEVAEAETITLFAGGGGRIDHLLTHLVILTRFPGRLTLITETEKIFAIDKSVTLSLESGQTLSLIPMNGAATGITTRGLKWELSNGRLDKSFVGTSNEVIKSPVTITVQQGDLLCFISYSPS